MVVPLNLTCPSSREELFGLAGKAYTNNGIVVPTNRSLKRDGSMGAVMVAKDYRLPARSVAVFGQPSSLRPELSGIALALEDCPGQEDLSVLTDSLSAMRLLKSMQREDSLADALASEAAESDPVRSIALDQDPEAVYFNLKGSCTGRVGHACPRGPGSASGRAVCR
jgi:hypothetical protein